jgi:glc operon protein GlcG
MRLDAADKRVRATSWTAICYGSHAATQITVSVRCCPEVYVKRFLGTILAFSAMVSGAEISTKKALNMALMKTMVSTVEAEAEKRKVHVTVVIVDDSMNLLFLERMDGAALNTITFAQKKARHAAFYHQPSKNAADQVKGGNLTILAMPEAFPNQGGLPIKVDGETIGAIAVSGAASDVDEAMAQAAIDAAFPK